MGFDQYYICDGKKFYNIFKAFDHFKQKEDFVQYVIDKDFVLSLQNIKKPKNLSTQYVKNLMVSTLKSLRTKHQRIRLAFSGGTDSWTILKLCVQNDIFIDQVVCQLNSFTNNPRSNIEYLPGINYAKKQVGKTIGELVLNPMTTNALKFFDDTEWYKKTFGPFIPMRTAILQKYLKDMDDKNYITISGLEKPTLYVENKKIYWTNLDEKCFGEFMGFENHYPFFYSKNNPELTVAITYLFLDNAPKSLFTNKSIVEYERINNVKTKKNILSLLGKTVDRPWINYHKLKSKSHANSIKTRYFFKELQQQRLGHYIEKNFKSMEHLYSKYKNIPYSVIMEDKWTKSVGRFSQKIQINADRFGKSDR